MIRARIVAVLAAVVAVAGLALAPAAGAATLTGHPAHTAAARRSFTGTWKIQEFNGPELYIGSFNEDAGSQVLTVEPGSLVRNMTIVDLGTKTDGFENYTVQFANNNYMASNDSCTGVTIKSSVTSNGTVWNFADYNGGTGLQSRYCYTTGGADANELMYGGNTQNQQWGICSDSTLQNLCAGTGFYVKLGFTAVG